MKEKIIYFLKKTYKKINSFSKKKKIAVDLMTDQAGNNLIKAKIESKNSLMVSRIGTGELECINNYFQIEKNKNKTGLRKIWTEIKDEKQNWSEKIKKSLPIYNGFFPTDDESLYKFSKEFIEHSKQIDVLGIWFNDGEEIFYKKICPEVKLTPLMSIEPYYHKNPWSETLSEKKVLIIHPFEKSIQMQYQKRELLFKDKRVLPKFNLITIKAVQTISGEKSNFNNWFEAFEYMCKKIEKIDFDIALIGAGAYGLPLASFVKQQGKKAIHIGGALQILFGIKGKRWDEDENVNKFYNEHWVRPLHEETPENFEKVEDGCYW